MGLEVWLAMKESKTCKTDCAKASIKQWYAEGKEISTELLLSCDDCFHEFLACEAAVVSLFPENLIHASNGSHSTLYESLDLEKAEKMLGNSKGHYLPDFLKHYTNENLATPEKKNYLLVRLSNKGFQVIQSLIDSVRVVETLNLGSSLRSATDTISEEHSSVIFEETISQDQTFYYQLIKENSEDVYLSVKAETLSGNPFKQVNLRKDGRFILSSMVSPEGSASFSGLKAGNYTIEFQGDIHSKSFDLCILLG